MTAQLVTDALIMAIWRRGEPYMTDSVLGLGKSLVPGMSSDISKAALAPSRPSSATQTHRRSVFAGLQLTIAAA